MNQFQWTYISNSGKPYRIGLLHGKRTGHLLVLCNAKIILIDFKVLKSSNYSFFINGELCELSIEYKSGNFFYGLDLNRKVDTPLNRFRKAEDKKYLFQGLAFVGVLLLLVFAFTFAMSSWQNVNSKEVFASLVSEKERKTVAVVRMETIGAHSMANFFFVADGQHYSVTKKIPADRRQTIHEYGMPLETGDEFFIRYTPGKPDRYIIESRELPPKQEEKYRVRALGKYLSLYPEQSSQYSECLIEMAYSYSGAEAYAVFYFQDAPVKEHHRFNRTTFMDMVQKVEKRCQSVR